METDEYAGIVVVVLAQKAQQRIAAGRRPVAGRGSRRTFRRRFRHYSRRIVRRRHLSVECGGNII